VVRYAALKGPLCHGCAFEAESPTFEKSRRACPERSRRGGAPGEFCAENCETSFFWSTIHFFPKRCRSAPLSTTVTFRERSTWRTLLTL
jgi:hypothetical protein